jgi:hypothetical protein
MAEGPVSFGKPLFFLVVIGCAGGGYYAYTHWPTHYDGVNWSIDFPTKWEAAPYPDPADGGNERVMAKGPLIEENSGEGVAWVTVNRHGTLNWPAFVQMKTPGTFDWSQEDELDHKKCLYFTYEDNNIRYTGVGVQRGDALVIAAIGCAKHQFAVNKERFEKCIKSVRVSR